MCLSYTSLAKILLLRKAGLLYLNVGHLGAALKHDNQVENHTNNEGGFNSFSKRGKLAGKTDLVNSVEGDPLSGYPWLGREGFLLGRWNGDKSYLTRRWKQLADDENFQDRQGGGNII